MIELTWVFINAVKVLFIVSSCIHWFSGNK